MALVFNFCGLLVLAFLVWLAIRAGDGNRSWIDPDMGDPPAENDTDT